MAYVLFCRLIAVQGVRALGSPHATCTTDWNRDHSPYPRSRVRASCHAEMEMACARHLWRVLMAGSVFTCGGCGCADGRARKHATRAPRQEVAGLGLGRVSSPQTIVTSAAEQARRRGRHALHGAAHALRGTLCEDMNGPIPTLRGVPMRPTWPRHERDLLRVRLFPAALPASPTCSAAWLAARAALRPRGMRHSSKLRCLSHAPLPPRCAADNSTSQMLQRFSFPL